MKKMKNAKIIENRRKQLIEKRDLNDKRIKKQKEENDKELEKRYLTIAMKREDTAANLERYERVMELERQKKLQKLIKKDNRLLGLQKQKSDIQKKKLELNMEMLSRKKVLHERMNDILVSGKYETLDDVYEQVFNEEELKILHASEKKKEDGKEENIDEKSNSDSDEVFVTNAKE